MWTAVVRCKTCSQEINRAEHVPQSEKLRVEVSAPLMALCKEPSHNTGSDYNLNYDLAWLLELSPTPTTNHAETTGIN